MLHLAGTVMLLLAVFLPVATFFCGSERHMYTYIRMILISFKCILTSKGVVTAYVYQ